MSTINERIAMCIEKSGLTKTAFAERLKVGQPFISKLAKGDSTPSDRTIADICREFNINEAWLRTGDGKMFRPVQDDERIADFVGRVFATEDDSFKRRFMAVLAGLTEEQWEMIRDKAEELAGHKEKD